MAETSEVDGLVKQANSKKLAEHPYWVKLLHYRQDKDGDGYKVRSEIISSDFFLSPDGSVNSGAELEATLRAFFEPPGKVLDDHAQCRFVARYQWLREVLDWEVSKTSEMVCQRYKKWINNRAVKSISLMFATGYLSNPASFYGHLLVKFNSNRHVTTTDLLDQSMNFGAIVPDNENPFVYMVKGLFGGYEATFSHAQFYRHNHNYGENELRDMWEYELDLTERDIDFIMAHSWELLDRKFVYYFATDNCAYQMAELLELVISQPLLPDNVPWAMPVSVFDYLASAKKEGKPVVKNITRIPSRQNRFYEKFSTLNSVQKDLVKVLVKNGIDFQIITYQKLSDDQRAEIIDALFDYYEFRYHDDKDSQLYKRAKHRLLLERIALPVQDEKVVMTELSPSPPHLGPRPTSTRLNVIHNSKFGNGVEVGFRPAYYDFLSIDAGRLKNSYLTMLDFSFAYLDDQFWIKKLDIVNVETLNLSRTGLPGDGGLAWKIKFGLENQSLGCVSCSVFNFKGGLGKAIAVNENSVAYAMFEGVVETHKNGWGGIGGIARLGLLASPAKSWKLYLSVAYEDFVGLSYPGRRISKLENRFGSSRDWDVRIIYEKELAHELKAAVSLYW